MWSGRRRGGERERERDELTFWSGDFFFLFSGWYNKGKAGMEGGGGVSMRELTLKRMYL